MSAPAESPASADPAESTAERAEVSSGASAEPAVVPTASAPAVNAPPAASATFASTQPKVVIGGVHYNLPHARLPCCFSFFPPWTNNLCGLCACCANPATKCPSGAAWDAAQPEIQAALADAAEVLRKLPDNSGCGCTCCPPDAYAAADALRYDGWQQRTNEKLTPLGLHMHPWARTTWTTYAYSTGGGGGTPGGSQTEPAQHLTLVVSSCAPHTYGGAPKRPVRKSARPKASMPMVVAPMPMAGMQPGLVYAQPQASMPMVVAPMPMAGMQPGLVYAQPQASMPMVVAPMPMAGMQPGLVYAQPQQVMFSLR